MSNIINLHFEVRCKVYGVRLKGPVEEETLLMLEARIYKRLSLYENKVKLQLSYIPLVVGCKEAVIISCDDDLVVSLTSFDKKNSRTMLYVEVINILELPEQLLRVDKIFFGMNYDELHGSEENVAIEDEAKKDEAKEDETKEDETKEGETKEDETKDDETKEDEMKDDEAKEEEGVDCNEEGVECEYNNTGRLDRYEEYNEVPPDGEHSQYLDRWEDSLGFIVLQEFKNKKSLQDIVDRGACVSSFGFRVVKSDRVRLVLKCDKDICKWGLQASKLHGNNIFSLRRYTGMHICSRSEQSTSNLKKKGTPELVASLLYDDYPGQMRTPSARIIMDLVKTKVGVNVSYSTALRGKNKAVSDLKGSPEESYKSLNSYLHMLKTVNPGTITNVELDENSKFKYLFVALGASIKGFLVMRKAIVVDATHLKNGYDGVLVFALSQDGNGHHYPLAFGVLDSENVASWNCFSEMLKTVVGDSSDLVFISDKNASLINNIVDVYPQAQHWYCIWHLSQNVRGHAFNVKKAVVAHRFLECSRMYIMEEFDIANASFRTRYPSAATYLEETTVKEKWARSYFPRQRFNLDTSNSVESLKSVFREARKYSLIPMLDVTVKKFSDWFNRHRKEAVVGSVEHKLVPKVDNYLHDLWVFANKLIVTELNSFELEYNVVACDGRHYLVSLKLKSCSCRAFNIDMYPCVHALAAFVELKNRRDKIHDIQLHEL